MPTLPTLRRSPISRRILAGGRLDVLVNNAGIEISQPLEDLDARVLDRTMAVDFVAPVRLTQLLLPALRASDHASVVNVTSIHESVPVRGNPAYCCAKAALAMFTRIAALELGPEGIRVNAIAPGAIETSHNSDLIDQIGRERFERWIPLGRIGSPQEVADAALFLAGDASRYVNGHTLRIDGGYADHLVRYGPD